MNALLWFALGLFFGGGLASFVAVILLKGQCDTIADIIVNERPIPEWWRKAICDATRRKVIASILKTVQEKDKCE